MQSQKINFRQERDFGKTFGDTLAFIKQNFKSLTGSMLLIAGPFLLLAGLAMGWLQSQSLSLSFFRGGFNLGNFYLSLVLIIFCSIVGHAALMSVVYQYMNLYNEKAPGEKITIAEVGRKTFSAFGRVLGSTLLLILAMIPVAIIIGLLFFAIGAGLGVFGAVLIVLLCIAMFLIFVPIISYYFPAGFFVAIRDRENIFTALGKVNKYMKGSFWWTWLIMFVAIIALYIIQIIFTLPASIVAGVSSLSRISQLSDMNAQVSEGPSVLIIILYTVSTVLSSLVSSIMLILCAFNFLGHEEKHEGAGLMSRIDEIQ